MTRNLLGKTVAVTINSALWKGTIAKENQDELLIEIVELLEGKSILKPGHRMEIDLRFPPSRWAQKRGYRVVAVDGRWL